MAALLNIKKTATAAEWKDWHWHLRNRITTYQELKKYIRLTPDEEKVFKAKKFSFRMAITPYYLSLIDHNNPHDPVRPAASANPAAATPATPALTLAFPCFR